VESGNGHTPCSNFSMRRPLSWQVVQSVPRSASRWACADQRSILDAIAKERNAYAHYDAPSAAFFPLLPRGKDVSPLLPFFVSTAVAPDGKDPRAVAVAKFRHAPYDTVAVVAENIGGRWRAISIVSVVKP
jgi:hypothetical protein